MRQKETEETGSKLKIVVITGGAAGIGKCMAEEFKKAGAKVAVIDLNSGGVDCDLYYCGDIARVNSIAPGWIDTEREEGSREDREQHPVKRVGRPEDIAKMAMYLCSEDSSFITGENITIDGGMTKQMIYHNDLGWSYQ